MNLEIKNIQSTDIDQHPEDIYNFVVPLMVEIGEIGKEGVEIFHFLAASPQGLQNKAISGHGFNILRGCILMNKFDWNVIYRAIENLINHARSRKDWEEVISYFNRYGQYDSEDMDGKHFP
jgi:hypothetical protein